MGETYDDLKFAALVLNVKRNQIKMMERRGFYPSIEDEPFKTITPDVFAKSQLVLDGRYQHPKPEIGRVLVLYYLDRQKKPGTDFISSIAVRMNNERYNKAFLISPLELTPPARNNFVFGIFFLFAELAYDILAYKDTPHHEVVPDDQKKALLEELKCPINQLPCIFDSDPVCKMYGFADGQIVKITRRSNYVASISGTAVNYRLVVKTNTI